MKHDINSRTFVVQRGLARAGALIALALVARADGVQTTLAGGYIQRLSSGGYTVEAEDLTTGKSSGMVSAVVTPEFPVLAADDLNLESYFARNGTPNPNWDVDLGNWVDRNGANVDFFVFEVGGNDNIQVAPIFPNGTVGAPSSVSGWTSTGFTVNTGPNKGQVVSGLAFRSSDLRYSNGSPLTPGQHIAGVRISSTNVDGAAFAAVAVPDVTPPTFVLSNRAYVKGAPHRWSPMEVVFHGGPHMSVVDNLPNPFLDFRLQVRFQGPGGQTIEVPGFFDGDGQGGRTGNVWKARFTPPSVGAWTATALFRKGTNVAISLVASDGQPAGFNGATVTFNVQNVPTTAGGFHRRGMLRYVGQHYLRFDDGTYFLKGGTDSPENLLAYFGFDEVADAGNIGVLHRFAPHIGDWKSGDPDWVSATTGESARGLIGAVNYLASKGVNSMYMLLMNLGGDGQDVCPFVGYGNNDFDKTHYDVRRLDEWNRFFQHAQSKGLLLHFVLAETEWDNEHWLDNGQLGAQRKLFFREMIARFGHHNAIKWNLCEENDWSPADLSNFADYILALDPYDHPIAVHNWPDNINQYSVLAGNGRFAMTAAQFDPNAAGSQVETFRNMSAQAGHPWAVEMDENTPAQTGLQPGNADDLRKRTLWDVYFSGGAGIEWYFGYQPNPIGGDVDAEDFHNRQDMWRYMLIARLFLEQNLPFAQMSPRDNLVSGETNTYGGAEVFSQKGQAYAVYYPQSNATGTLDLSETTNSFTLRWFNPRTGLLEGNSKTVQGGGPLTVGAPPSSPSEDWVLWLKKI